MADLTPERLAQLRGLVALATPGPWRVESHLDMLDPPATWHIPDLARSRGFTDEVGFGEDEATVRYVAAVSPDVVLGLLDEIERLKDALVLGHQMMGSMKGPQSPADEELWLAFELALADLFNEGALNVDRSPVDEDAADLGETVTQRRPAGAELPE